MIDAGLQDKNFNLNIFFKKHSLAIVSEAKNLMFKTNGIISGKERYFFNEIWGRYKFQDVQKYSISTV